MFSWAFFLKCGGVHTKKLHTYYKGETFFLKKMGSILFWVKIGYLWNFKFHCNISDSLKTLCNYSERTTLCSE